MTRCPTIRDRSTLSQAASPTFNVVLMPALLALMLLGCGDGSRTPRPLAPPVRAPAPWLEQAPPTLRNALAQRTREPLRLRVIRAVMSPGFSWLQVRDYEAAEAWVATPALSVTPTEAITVADYVVLDGDALPAGETRVEHILLASDVAGSDVQLAPSGDTEVLNPLLPPIETTATTAVKPSEFESIGPTLADLSAHRTKLAGHTVRVRAQAMQVMPRVAGLNWAWLRDSSTTMRSQWVLVAVRQAIEPGSVIDIEGVLTADRRIGDYRFAVVLDPARLLVKEADGEAAPATPEPARAPADERR